MNTNQIRLDTGFPVGDAGICPKPTGGVRAWLGRTLAAFRRHQQRRRAISELVRMSDWRLADLGIPREQIPEVVDGLMARERPSFRACGSELARE